MTTISQTSGVSAAPIDAAREWRSSLTGLIGALLVFETITGFAIYLLPFSEFNQFSVILHTLIGIGMLLPMLWFVIRHWLVRGKGNLSHYQLLGYVSLAFLVICIISGLVLTWQSIVGPRINYTWDVIHLLTGIGIVLFIVIHLVTVIVRKSKTDSSPGVLLKARRRFYLYSTMVSGLLLALCGLWTTLYQELPTIRSFSDDYNWHFGEDRPFAPSLARLDYSAWNDTLQQQVLKVIDNETQQTAYLAALEEQSAEPVGFFTRVKQITDQLNLKPDQQRQIAVILADAVQQIKTTGSIEPYALARSDRCGTSGCHEQIYKEWLPSAHRYSSLDDMFQRVQALMATETSPEHTRYCAGCHDPISLFTGAKNSGNITLSVEGANEGSSCLVCHSIVQTDIQGNGDYTIKPARRYVYELEQGQVAEFLSDFLIRAYPRHHLTSYSRSMYKTPEFCGACHKQYLDKEVNTDIGRVQGQNQYDSWKNSRWYHEDNPQKTVTCRECHMPLVESQEPARGDVTDYNRSAEDGKHRSHRMLAANQYIPTLQNLEGAEQHVALTEKWLRGEIEIPEIADKWMTGPVVRMKIIAPAVVLPDQNVNLQVILTNNKTGHDFPNGPLDMIESWVEIIVTDDDSGKVLYHVGGLDEKDMVNQSPIIFKADGFDRQGKLIDRHNLWDLVGASYKRALYPGMTDAVQVRFQCPSMARGRVGDATSPPGQRTDQFSFPAPAIGIGEVGQLTVTAVLWYRKANPDFLDTIYGIKTGMRSPITKITEESTKIKVEKNVQASTQ